MLGKMRDVVYNVIGWATYKIFGFEIHPEYYIYKSNAKESVEEDMEELRSKFIDSNNLTKLEDYGIESDNICYMTVNEAWELKQKMKDDINVAKTAIAEAEALYDGKINGGGCLFNRDVLPDFLCIKSNEKIDMKMVKQYYKEWKEEEQFDNLIEKMEKEKK